MLKHSCSVNDVKISTKSSPFVFVSCCTFFNSTHWPHLSHHFHFLSLICLPFQRSRSENKGSCVPTRSTVLFAIWRIGPRSPLKLLKYFLSSGEPCRQGAVGFTDRFAFYLNRCLLSGLIPFAVAVCYSCLPFALFTFFTLLLLFANWRVYLGVSELFQEAKNCVTTINYQTATFFTRRTKIKVAIHDVIHTYIHKNKTQKVTANI